ncbi:unnamed protein product [Phytophthora lilii]|uniref:Unnamed protein product n=1 Tax=Phytophthora lilii TaxID=2077276 RepID=A0A9W6U527_9STRA|nr:unnamed protein product [Phytophthora lilii]
MDDQDQRAFMHSVMDEQVDVGNGLHGPDVMMDQMTIYSTFIKFIRLTMHSFDIVVAENLSVAFVGNYDRIWNLSVAFVGNYDSVAFVGNYDKCHAEVPDSTSHDRDDFS